MLWFFVSFSEESRFFSSLDVWLVIWLVFLLSSHTPLVLFCFVACCLLMVRWFLTFSGPYFIPCSPIGLLRSTVTSFVPYFHLWHTGFHLWFFISFLISLSSFLSSSDVCFIPWFLHQFRSPLCSFLFSCFHSSLVTSFLPFIPSLLPSWSLVSLFDLTVPAWVPCFVPCSLLHVSLVSIQASISALQTCCSPFVLCPQ